MIQGKQINILNSNVETYTITENCWIRTDKKQNKKTPTQIQDVISKISATCLYHSLSHSSELNWITAAIMKLPLLVQPCCQWHCPLASIRCFSFPSRSYFHKSTRWSKQQKIRIYHNISNNSVICVKKPTNLTLHGTMLF